MDRLTRLVSKMESRFSSVLQTIATKGLSMFRRQEVEIMHTLGWCLRSSSIIEFNFPYIKLHEVSFGTHIDRFQTDRELTAASARTKLEEWMLEQRRLIAESKDTLYGRKMANVAMALITAAAAALATGCWSGFSLGEVPKEPQDIKTQEEEIKIKSMEMREKAAEKEEKAQRRAERDKREQTFKTLATAYGELAREAPRRSDDTLEALITVLKRFENRAWGKFKTD
ncbi:hypothetical protein TWF281_007570 [Arthrobotrys megalospora]